MEPELLAMLTDGELLALNAWRDQRYFAGDADLETLSDTLPESFARSLAEARQDLDALEGDAVAWRLRAQANARGDDLIDAFQERDAAIADLERAEAQVARLRNDLLGIAEAGAAVTGSGLRNRAAVALAASEEVPAMTTPDRLEQVLTVTEIEERRQNLAFIRKNCPEGDHEFTTTLIMQEEWLATIDAERKRAERADAKLRAAVEMEKAKATRMIGVAHQMQAHSRLITTADVQKSAEKKCLTCIFILRSLAAWQRAGEEEK